MKNNAAVNGLLYALLLSGLLFSPLLYSKRSMATENQPADETPSLEFLEFLGSWEDSDGQWIDPYQLQDTQYADELDQNPDKENKLGGDQTSNKPDNKKSGMKDMTNEK